MHIVYLLCRVLDGPSVSPPWPKDVPTRILMSWLAGGGWDRGRRCGDIYHTRSIFRDVLTSARVQYIIGRDVNKPAGGGGGCRGSLRDFGTLKS